MFTLEQKVNIALTYIATDNELLRKQLKSMAARAVPSFDVSSEPDASQPNTQCAVDVEELIHEHLRYSGMPPHLIGYEYTVTAIKLCLTNSEYLRQITCALYPDIASHHNTTPSRTERAIRHAIEVCFDRGDLEYLMAAFGNTSDAKRGKLTNSEFIAGSVNRIRSRMKKLSVK